MRFGSGRVTAPAGAYVGDETFIALSRVRERAEPERGCKGSRGAQWDAGTSWTSTQRIPPLPLRGRGGWGERATRGRSWIPVVEP